MDFATHDWLRRTKSAGVAARLICFPHAGAGAGSFATWVKAAPAPLEICAVQLPGRETVRHLPPVDDLGRVVPPIAAAVREVTGTGPAPWLYGHSMGAALAYHVACHLAAQGAGPAGLIVSGRRAPHLPQSRPAHHELAEEDLVEEMRRADPASQLWLRPHWRRPYLALLRADSAALERLGPQPAGALELPILAYHGRQDPWVSAFEIEQWQRVTRGAFELRHYDGAHSDHHMIRHEVMAHVLANDGAREVAA